MNLTQRFKSSIIDVSIVSFVIDFVLIIFLIQLGAKYNVYT